MALENVTDVITSTANRYGVDPNLALAVAKQESGFNQDAVSSEGAIGIYQLMPGTARDLGVNPNDPVQNIEGGIKYLSQLLARFNGNVSLALAGYNAGPENVEKYGGIPPFAETQNYVGSIINMWNGVNQGLNPTDSGGGGYQQYLGPNGNDILILLGIGLGVILLTR